MPNKIKKYPKTNNQNFVLGADIGGTHTVFGLAGVEKNSVQILHAWHFDSKKIESFVPVLKTVADFLEQHKLNISQVCLAAAGILVGAELKMTNAHFTIDKLTVKKFFGLTPLIINDFAAIGYSLPQLAKKDLFLIKSGQPFKNGNMALIGAGTGLGKNILINNNCIHTPLHSEGGHGDLPVYNQEEMNLRKAISKRKKIKQVSYEDILSGSGIELLYNICQNKFQSNKYSREIKATHDKVPLIAKYKTKDPACREVFRIFTKFYGRCAKNFALETMSTDGLYIAGGIAAQNKEIFKSKIFLAEFLNSDKRKEVLRQIPIYVITNRSAGLLGACKLAADQINNE